LNAKLHANSAAQAIILHITVQKSLLKNVSTASKKAIWLMAVKTLRKKECKHVVTAMKKATWVVIVRCPFHAKYAAQKNILWLTAQTNSASIAVKWVMEVVHVLNQRR
jgi:hypothetical protein